MCVCVFLDTGIRMLSLSFSLTAEVTQGRQTHPKLPSSLCVVDSRAAGATPLPWLTSAPALAPALLSWRTWFVSSFVLSEQFSFSCLDADLRERQNILATVW